MHGSVYKNDNNNNESIQHSGNNVFGSDSTVQIEMSSGNTISNNVVSVIHTPKHVLSTHEPSQYTIDMSTTNTTADDNQSYIHWLYSTLLSNYYDYTGSIHNILQIRKFDISLDLFCICVVLGLAESTRGIVIPTLSSFVAYLNSTPFMLSFIVAVFSVGRLLSSVVYGHLLDKDYSTRTIMTTAVLISTVGNMLYIMSDLFISIELLSLARTLTGFGTGVLSVARTYVTRRYKSDKSKQTIYMSILGVVQFMGFTLTPVIGGLSVNFNAIIHVDQYTFGSWLIMIFDIILLALLPYAMTTQSTRGSTQHKSTVIDVRDASKDELRPLTPNKRSSSSAEIGNIDTVDSDSDTEHTDDDIAVPSTLHNSHTNNEQIISVDNIVQTVDRNIEIINDMEAQSQPSTQPIPQTLFQKAIQYCQHCVYISIQFVTNHPTECLCVSLNGVTRGVLGVAESFGTDTYVMAQHHVDDDIITDAGLFYSLMGLIGCITYVSINKLTQYCTHINILISGLCSSGIGFLLLMAGHNHLSETRLTVGSLFIWSFGSPLIQTVLVVIFSHQLSKSNDTLSKTGAYMGAFTAAGSIGRIVVPVVSGALYATYGQPAAYLFAAICVILLTLFTVYMRTHLSTNAT